MMQSFTETRLQKQIDRAEIEVELLRDLLDERQRRLETLRLKLRRERQKVRDSGVKF